MPPSPDTTEPNVRYEQKKCLGFRYCDVWLRDGQQLKPLRLFLPGKGAPQYGRFRLSIYWLTVSVFALAICGCMLKHSGTTTFGFAVAFGMLLLAAWGLFWNGVYEFHVENLKRLQSVLVRNPTPENLHLWQEVRGIVETGFCERIRDEVPLLFDTLRNGN